MAGIFRSIARRIFGGGRGRAAVPPEQVEAEAEAKRAAQRVNTARNLGQRAAQAEQLGREQAAQARGQMEQARRRGDKRAEMQARKDEQAAISFADKQRREQIDLKRKEREALADRQQALKDAEQIRTRARLALLKTRKEAVERGEEFPFQGPAPTSPEVYKNIKEEGALPDLESFLRGFPYTGFASSNVMTLQYDPRGADLYIEFIGGRWYRYPGVGKAFAVRYYTSASKGVFTWDEIRVRGDNPRLPSPPASTRRAFDRFQAPPSDLPLTSS